MKLSIDSISLGDWHYDLNDARDVRQLTNDLVTKESIDEMRRAGAPGVAILAGLIDDARNKPTKQSLLGVLASRDIMDVLIANGYTGIIVDAISSLVKTVVDGDGMDAYPTLERIANSQAAIGLVDFREREGLAAAIKGLDSEMPPQGRLLTAFRTSISVSRSRPETLLAAAPGK